MARSCGVGGVLLEAAPGRERLRTVAGLSFAGMARSCVGAGASVLVCSFQSVRPIMPSLNPPTVHQFANDCTPGDGITNGMLLTRKLLRGAGVVSDIYCAEIHPDLCGDVLPMADYRPGCAGALLVHHGLGNPHEAWLRSLPEAKFMVFHNITPGHLFPADHPIQPLLAQGWEQVASWRHWLAGTIADSRQNLQELLQRGHEPERLIELPLLIDLDRIVKPIRQPDAAVPRPFTLLFVGRVMPHKNQLALVEAFAALRQRARQPLRLDLVGGFTVPEYAQQVQQRIRALGLESAVTLTGKVSNAVLAEHYRNSDLFVGLSLHEGFGMPFIEAMAYGLPVVAYDAPGSNVADTLGGAGLLLPGCGPLECAAALDELVRSPARRMELVERGRLRLHAFEHASLAQRLLAYLLRHGVTQLSTLVTTLGTRDQRPIAAGY